MARRWPSLLILLIFGGACGPAAPPAPTATQVPDVTVGISALPLARSLAVAYLNDQGPLPFDLVPTATDSGLAAVEADRAEFHLDYPPVPEGWFATPLAWEGMAIIVHPEVPTRRFTIDELAAIVGGHSVSWQELTTGEGEIQVVVPPPGDRFRQALVDQIIPGGRVTSRALIAPTPQAAVELVSTTPGALGLLPSSFERPPNLPVARVEGVLPGPSTLEDGSYPLRVPLLALSPREPEGSGRQWLVWAQSLSAVVGDPPRTTETIAP